VTHRLPHAPQFCASTSRVTQVLLHTFGNSLGHLHSPPTQTSFVSGQAFPQADESAPQFDASVSVFTHRLPQGVGSELGQLHSPPTHTSFRSGQTFPHAEDTSRPQFSASDSTSVQTSPQSSASGGTHRQIPAAHPSPGLLQVTAHAPQFWGSFSVSLQRGFAPAQKVALGSHAQAPPAHVPRPQAIPHAPQLLASLP
jgi:hypothetical protein